MYVAPGEGARGAGLGWGAWSAWLPSGFLSTGSLAGWGWSASVGVGGLTFRKASAAPLPVWLGALGLWRRFL